MASRRVVLPLWKGPTSAMHRGPRGLLTSCPISPSPLVRSSARDWVGKRSCSACPNVLAREKSSLRCDVHAARQNLSPLFTERGMRGRSTSRTKFQALETGGDVDSDLALQAERLQRDGIVGAADQHIAAGADAERGAALRAGIVARKVTRPEARDRRKHGPGQRRLF